MRRRMAAVTDGAATGVTSQEQQAALERRVGSLERSLHSLTALVALMADQMERSQLRGLALQRLLMGFNFECRREQETLRRVQDKFRKAAGQEPPESIED